MNSQDFSFSHFFSLVLTKVRLNLKSEASQSYLSYAWWVLEPAFLVAVFYVVFGIFLSRGGEDFVAFLITGQIPFVWISRSISNSSASLMVGKNLINQIKILPVFFPLVVVIQDLVKIVFVYILMLAVLMLLGHSPTENWAYLPVIMLLQFMLLLSVSIFIAALVPFVPDLRYIIGTGLMMLMFSCGIFYKIEEVLLQEHRDLFLLNPFARLISYHRDVLLYDTGLNSISVFYDFLLVSTLLILSISFIHRFRNSYPNIVS